MHRLKGHDLWSGRVRFLKQLSKVIHVIVTEDELLDSAVSYALNHGSMVPCVRVDFTTWRRQHGTKCLF